MRKNVKIIRLNSNREPKIGDLMSITTSTGHILVEKIRSSNDVEQCNRHPEVYKPIDLYVVSSEELKDEDWVLIDKTHLVQVTKSGKKRSVGKVMGKNVHIYVYPNYDLKVLLTTNPDLNLPRPSVESINAYCEKCEEGDSIKALIEFPQSYRIVNSEIAELIDLIDEDSDITFTSKETIVKDVPMDAIKDMLRYCEDNAIYDKMAKWNDPYYKLKKWVEDNTLKQSSHNHI